MNEVFSKKLSKFSDLFKLISKLSTYYEITIHINLDLSPLSWKKSIDEFSGSELENVNNSVYAYKCHVCDLSSKTKYLLDLHIKTVHNQRNQQKTSVTEMVDLKPNEGSIPSTKSSVNEETSKYSDGHQCPTCGRLFPNKTNLKSHNEKVHKGKIVKVTMLGQKPMEVLSGPETEKLGNEQMIPSTSSVHEEKKCH